MALGTIKGRSKKLEENLRENKKEIETKTEEEESGWILREEGRRIFPKEDVVL